MTIRLARDEEPAAPSAATVGYSLKGHKLLMLVPAPFLPPPEYLEHLSRRFPGLEIFTHAREWADGSAPVPSADGGWRWEDITILITGSALPDKEQAVKLQYVQLLSAGANHILKHPLFAETDITFCTANGVHGPQISEWIVGTLLSFEHHLPPLWDQQKESLWDRKDAYQKVTDSVGRRLGVLGYGSIGRQTARLCKALGMDVHAYTLHPRNTAESRRDTSYAPPGTGDPEGLFPSKWFSGGSKEDLHQFLSSGLDVLVISTPLTDKTTHLLGAEEFEILSQRGTFVSNIARGPIIDTDALLDALDTGKIRGAALDVTDPEPLPKDHALWKAKNVMITPHVSAASSSYGKRILSILDGNLERLSQGKTLMNRVSRKDGY
ncbi:hypothetical protein MCOR25_009923 [Pyricularia grisea]|nr:hypothetical protein MCOR25_009923 [Pyricularia grisea]